MPGILLTFFFFFSVLYLQVDHVPVPSPKWGYVYRTSTTADPNPTHHPPTHLPHTHKKPCKIKDTNHPIKRTADINRVELRNRLILPKLPSLTTEFQPNVCLHSPNHVILDLDRKAAAAPLSDFALSLAVTPALASSVVSAGIHFGCLCGHVTG